MRWFQLRPSFRYSIHGSRDEAIVRLQHVFERVGQPSIFFMHGEYGELHLPVDEHRLWSPHLSFYLIEPPDPENLARGDAATPSCDLRGLFAPRPDVWTFVWILYLVFAFTAFFALIFAYVQWMLAHSLSGLWVAIFSCAVLLCIYVVAHVGQQWSSDQMRDLELRLDQMLEQAGIVKVER